MASLPSERSFGFFFAGLFAFMGGYTWIKGASSPVLYGCLAMTLITLLVTLINPKLLVPLNRSWFWLGEMIGKVVSPLVLGMIFFLLLAPISLVSRLFGRDELRMKKSVTASYWIDRSESESTSTSFTNQF
jgi:hypothetical protein